MKNKFDKAKKLALISLFFLFYAFLANGQVQSSCKVPSNLYANYDKDIKLLALNYILKNNLTYKDSIFISKNIQDSIWADFAAIYNLPSAFASDTIFNILKIHSESCFGNINNTNEINVVIDTSYSFFKNWMKLNIKTENTDLDNFMAYYGFTISRYYNYFGNPFFSLKTNLIINLTAFCDSLKKFKGIIDAYTIKCGGDANSITYNKNGNIRNYKFILSWGDCPSGCLCHKTWEYTIVNNQCQVYYNGFYNSDFGNCYLPPDTHKIVIPAKIYHFINPQICFGETYLAGKKNQTISGTYYDTLKNKNNIDSIIVTNLTVKPSPAVPIIKLSNDTIISSASNGVKWYNSFGFINNLNTQYYKPTNSDKYYVEVINKYGCKAKSSVINYIYNYIKTINPPTITISPNPAEDFITISGKIEVESYKVFDIAGKEIIVGNGNLINVSNLNKGIYFVRVTTGDNKIYNSKFIKE